MPSTPIAQLPVADFSRLQNDRVGLARDVVKSLQNIGFLAIKNIPGHDTDKLLKMCKWFFDRPLETKMALARQYWNPLSPKIYRGYFPIDYTNWNHYEGFEMGLPVAEDDPELLAGNVMYENPLWPPEDGTIKFKEEMHTYFNRLQKTGVECMRLIAIGLGLDEHVFDYLVLEKPLSTLKLMHYPPRKGEVPEVAKTENGKILVLGDHADSRLVTLLETFTYDGLEVLDTDNVWKAVKAEPGTLVVNIGEMLSQLTGGQLKATRHRVVDYGVDRYSLPFFLEPNFHVDISHPPLRPDTVQMEENMKARYGDEPLKFGHWFIKRTKEKQNFEYAGLEKLLKY